LEARGGIDASDSSSGGQGHRGPPSGR